MAHKKYILRRLKYSFGGYKRKSPKHKKFNLYIPYFIMVIVICATILFCGGKKLFSLSLSIGTDRIKNDIQNNCSRIVADTMSEYNFNYSSLLNSRVDDNGRVNSLCTDFNKINIIKTSLEQKLTDYLSKYNSIKVDIPIGALFSDNFFSTIGPKIPIGILSSSEVTVDFHDTFDSGGINQTKHSIMLKISIFTKLHSGFSSAEKPINIDIPIAETIVVGETPELMLK